MKPKLLKYLGLAIISSCLPACSHLAGVSGNVYYRDAESGAKGGLVFQDGKASGYLRYPVVDADGNVVGMVDIGSDEIPVIAEK